jgi:hypothetical protein
VVGCLSASPRDLFRPSRCLCGGDGGFARSCGWTTSAQPLRVREYLAVEVKRDRLLTQLGKAEVEVFPGEIRHLVDALEEGTTVAVDWKAQEK